METTKQDFVQEALEEEFLSQTPLIEKKEEPLVIQTNFEKSLELFKKIQFHKSGLKLIKDRLGNKCSYLSWTRNGNGIKAIISGKEIEVVLGGTPDDVGYEEYESLFEKLNVYGKEN